MASQKYDVVLVLGVTDKKCLRCEMVHLPKTSEVLIYTENKRRNFGLCKECVGDIVSLYFQGWIEDGTVPADSINPS